nr:MAG TPA: hypothetical protein [Caudoviricetes sp.]
MTSGRFSRADIRENAECVLPLRLYPYAIAVLRAVLISHPSRAEDLFEVFQEPSLAETARREGGVRRGGTRCARILVIILNSPAPLPKRETAHFVALNRMCRVPDPYSAVALRASDCLLRSRRSPLCLSFLSEVGFLKH